MLDFSKTVRSALARKGVSIIGTCVIPNTDSDLPFATGSRGYKLNDNGTHRIRSYSEVLELAR